MVLHHFVAVLSKKIYTLVMNRLLLLREEKGISQESVAQLLNVSRQAYSRYERGERELGYPALLKLSQFFDVSVDYLLGFSELYYPDKIQANETYTVEEQKIISDFRQLSPNCQKLVRDTITNFLSVAARGSNKNIS